MYAIRSYYDIMRGKPGTPIALTLVRKGESEPLEINIVRDIIKIQSVYAKQIGDDILYIRVTSFDKKVVDDVATELKKHMGHDKGIILRITSYNVCYTKLLRSLCPR